MKRKKKVKTKVFLFFRLANALPAGRGFVCMNLENIPQIIQQIFTSSLLRSNK